VPSLDPLPQIAAWRHVGPREGTEVLVTARTTRGHRLTGHTTAVEGGSGWSVGYVVEVDDQWRTLVAEVSVLAVDGTRRTRLERRPDDTWLVDGAHAPWLDGCVDVDLESSAVTNTLPVHRLPLPLGRTADVPAAFVRADDLRVERLEQTYARLDRAGEVAYTSSTFDFACTLVYDDAGLVLDYPGIAVRLC
jgi:hypothetical protein